MLAYAILALAAVLGGGIARAQEPPSSPGAPPSEERIEAEITVFEATLALDPGDLSFRDRQRLRPDQVLVIEGGAPRRVTNIETADPGAWRILIYVDAPLSRARTLRLASLRLGGEARRLTDLGTVEIVVADPEPRTVFGPSREATPLAVELGRLGEAELGSDRLSAQRAAFSDIEDGLAAADPRRAQALLAETTLVRERVDHLLLRAAQGCDGSPCLLLLVSDGFYEEPASFYLGEGQVAEPDEARPALEAALELAQTVAGYEWIALPLPLREDRLETPVVAQPRSDLDVFLDHTGAVRRLPRARDKEPAISLDALEVSVAPILQPLQRLAVSSSGRVVRIADDVAPSLETLPERRRVFYLTDRPLDGDLRPVSARLATGSTVLTTPTWVRSSTPPAVSAARARALLAGRPVAGGDVPLAASIEPGGDGRATLAVEARWGDAAELVAKSQVRVSVSYPRSGGVPWVGHLRLAPGELADGVWRHQAAVPLPTGVGRVAVVVEALVPRVWGSALIDPAPPR
jgi:hypothetical protein